MNNILGLNRIYFLKSAMFDSEELRISDNSLLLGNSGVGKTSIMRACLFFYTMNYDNLGINTTSGDKRSFSEHYFDENGASHIAYEYFTNNGRFLFVVSRTKHLRYTFANIDEDIQLQKMFLNEENKPFTFDEFVKNLRLNKYDFFSTSNKDTYKKVFCKNEYRKFNKDIKDEINGVNYYFYDDMESSKLFGDYISKIFLNSKVSQENIQDVLIEHLDSSLSSNIKDSFMYINIEDVKSNLLSIVEESNDIETFKLLGNDIEKCDGKIKDYLKTKKDYEHQSKKLVAIYHGSEEAISSLGYELRVLKDKEDEEEKEVSISKDDLESKIRDLELESRDLEKKIKRINKRIRHYETINITEILALDKKEDDYKFELSNLNTKLDLVSADIKTINNEFERKKVELIGRITEKYDGLNDEKDGQLRELHNEKDSILAQEIEKRKPLEELSKEINILKIEISGLENKINVNNVKIKGIENSEKSNATTKKLKGEIDELKKEEKSLLQKINDSNIHIDEIKTKRKENSGNFTKLVEEQENKSAELVERLKEKIDEINEQLKIDKNNIYGYIHKTNYPNKDKILKTIDKEVLFYEFKNDISQREHDLYSNLLLGLDIDFSVFSNNYDSVVLENKKRELSSSISIEKSSLKSQKGKLENNARKVEKDLKSKLDIENNNLFRNQNKLESIQFSILEKENILNDEIESIKKTNEINIRQLEDENFTFELQYNQKKETEKQREAHLNAESDSINLWVNNKRTTVGNKILEAEAIKKGYKSQKESEIKEKSSDLEKQHQEVINKADINKEEIEQLKLKIKDIESMLSSITSNKKTIYDYQNDKEDIESISLFEDEQKSILEAKSRKEEKLEGVKKDYKTFVENCKKERKVKSTKKDEIKSFKDTMENFLSIDFDEYESDEFDIKSICDMSSFLNGYLVETKETKELLEEYEKILIILIKKICTKLKPNNRLGLIVLDSDYMEDDLAYLDSIFQKYYEWYKNDLNESKNDLMLENIRDCLSRFSSSISEFKVKIQEMSKKVNELNNVIRNGIEDIMVIDEISIDFKTDEHYVLQALQKLIDFGDKHSQIYLGGLQGERDCEIYEELLSEINNTIDEISIFKKNELTLKDVTAITFFIAENGNSKKELLSLSDIGSNGTGILIRTMVFISMLELACRRARISDNQVFHCILDEIGQISPNYFSELLKFVKNNNFVFLNGMPLISDEMVALYPSVFTGVTEGKKSYIYESSKEYKEYEFI